MSELSQDCTICFNVADDFGTVDRDHQAKAFQLSALRGRISDEQLGDIMAKLRDDGMVCGEEDSDLTQAVADAVRAISKDLVPQTEPDEHLEILLVG